MCSITTYSPYEQSTPRQHQTSLIETMSVPSKMKAIKIAGVGKPEIQEVPVPKLRDDYALVKVKAVALNPTDW